MATYRMTITKTLEDGKEVTVFTETGPGWFISPWLEHWGKRLYEPRPRSEFEGQTELFPRAA